MRVTHIPLRLSTGAFILNAGWGKRHLDKDSAAGLQAMAARVIPAGQQNRRREVRQDAQLRGNDPGCRTADTLPAQPPGRDRPRDLLRVPVDHVLEDTGHDSGGRHPPQPARNRCWQKTSGCSASPRPSYWTASPSRRCKVGSPRPSWTTASPVPKDWQDHPRACRAFLSLLLLKLPGRPVPAFPAQPSIPARRDVSYRNGCETRFPTG
jgi:hypothetical protein